MKLPVLVVFSMVTLTFSGFAQAQNNVATVTVDNQTDSTAQFTFEHLVGTANPMFSAVQRKQASTSKVTSYSPLVSGMRFTYTSGAKACRFSASHTSGTGNTPVWNKDARSIGSSRAKCSVVLQRVSAQPPYDYTVKFTIQ